jgi:hypothetical protein
VFGNGARGHAKGAAGGGEATSVDDPDEGRHACCAVHQSLRLQGQRDRFALRISMRRRWASRYDAISGWEKHVAIATQRRFPPY